MEVLVTGSSGRIGRYVVRELIQAGHGVVGVDVAPEKEPGCRSLLVDLTDAGQVFQALARIEAVVHIT